MSDQVTVQQVHPSWFDWITVAAIILGPVLALFAQRVLDWWRAQNQRRRNLYLTAMSYRAPATWLHPDSLRALNSIDTVFDRDSDEDVRDAWAAVITHAYTPRPDARTQPEQAIAWDTKMLDLRVDLYQLLGAAVGDRKTLEYIKTRMYYPQYHVDAEAEWRQIRNNLNKVVSDSGIKVIVS